MESTLGKDFVRNRCFGQLAIGIDRMIWTVNMKPKIEQFLVSFLYLK